VGTTIQVPECGSGTTWVIRADLDADNRLYAAFLTALTAGKQIEIYQWSCVWVDGSPYGRIGAVKVLN
jgi:hypothetical protein